MSAGYREIPHTADWELYVYAPDLPALLEQAATGMAALAGVRLDPALPARRDLRLEALDAESLLVSFLSEILWLNDHDRLGFDRFEITITGAENLHLHARLEGGALVGLDKEIKAVTWHKLAVRSAPGGLETNIVFDV